VTPYLNIGQYYSFTNRMFQTNQGPSFPAHQFLLTGTSAPTQPNSPPYNAWFAAENPLPIKEGAGCTAQIGVYALEVDPNGNESPGYSPPEPWPDPGYPCYDHPTLTDLFENNQPQITWKYYTPNDIAIWTAPNAIFHICQPSGGSCTGMEWKNNVILDPRQVLADINNVNCSANALAQVSWVIPSAPYSDHGNENEGYGPDWVGSIVNSVGSSHCGYWNNTAILITWDDWGGFYDHVPVPPPRNQYELGFRVPLMVVSAYTGIKNPDGSYSGYVSCPVPVGNCPYNPLDFGSILQFIESNFKLGFIANDTYADEQAVKLDPGFFGLTSPRPFQAIPGLTYDATFFLGDTLNPNEDPDDD
jgi:hypothetical protein